MNQNKTKQVITPFGYFPSIRAASRGLNLCNETLRRMLVEENEKPISKAMVAHNRLLNETMLGKTPKEIGWRTLD